MNDNNIRKKIVFIINIIYILVWFAIIYIALKYAFSLILPFITAFAISILIEPIVNCLSKNLKFKRTFSVALTILILLIIIGLLLTILSVTVFDGVKMLYKNLPQYKESLLNFIENSIKKDNKTIYSSILSFLLDNINKLDFAKILSGSFGSYLLSFMSNIVISIPSILVTVIITIVSVLFISSSLPEIKTFLMNKCPQKFIKLIIVTKKNTISIFKKYIKSYATLMIITFLELTAFFVIFKITPSATLALIISFVDALPILGVGIIMIPWSIILFMSGQTMKAITILSIYAVVAVVRQIIEPKIVGKSIGLHPVLTLISFYIGLKLFGIIGIIVLPISLIIFIDMHKKNYIKL